MWNKLVQKFIVLFFLLVFLPYPVYAAEEFSTSYDVSYDVQKDGITNVTQKINLKNLTSQYYVSNFTLTIGSTSITDLVASDEQGNMETSVESKDAKTAITVKFNAQIAGLDKSQTFTLKFKSKDFAQALGKTWEVNLPKIPSQGKIDGYNLVLSVPISFGDPTSVSPQPKSESQSFEKLFFSYSKQQLEKSGVSVNFGTTQVYDFNIKYPLENNSLFPVLTTITLPPDSNYQDVFISQITPEPLNITIDEDGNYLAWYRLSRGSKFEVSVNGSVKTHINPKSKKVPQLSASEIKTWTKSDTYWEADNPAVSNTLQEIFQDGTPKTNKEKVRLIYQYVVATLVYDTNRLGSNDIERLGALTALNNPTKSICMEFTDLFIALSRAAGVPARELDGFAYTQNSTLRPLSLSKDLLHAWPEYFDENLGWVMTDPTWENTSGGVDYFNKFDLNHVILAIKGVSSETPYISDIVKVEVSDRDFLLKPKLEVEIDLANNIWAGLPIQAKLKVKNIGNTVAPPFTLNLQSNHLNILKDKSLHLDSIPPFGFTEITLDLRTPFNLQANEDVLEVSIGEQKTGKKVSIKPLLSIQTYPYLAAAAVLLFLSIYGAILLIHIIRGKSKNSKRKF
ncbi:hypothetical protein A3H85_01505 [Candidatus Daviesbacteria bacterium RIFCSPLOWO2_02_FULL_40_8]|uniref:Transglutaminase-like domain-containing protein n=1 Tax=Candidatus Daviesbacteria bacterium RIFCSPLOWO2_01_FULL_40_24 TaxID=1797787 RepID=A0A1F5MK27_9BACT|nr:MAG: hypothetical protein A2780_01230 [Candidatus Daviesbacteria bacterium RIFCSPHIGHO2_01_FULL_41_45]OGE34425.1 MAG: hypothetical protein A3C32_03700 [Candidatus Daviesbacteria bacterium RIFCSPHIGHO2_02_FULL_41_14]OGE65669.1 MAG: hypothetical protein A3B49_03685 [Candidatus Daviesbacteria bacterium RIFCSPLOWO2_01_FULL_40_24]OGE66744.1 MAG: hypothetical protein A3H85_01505 [Candidatus Daviesbacteria bacterium RIFCSPLOWO2_02_FULL_40_8]OGH82361.1 MAG: hypothetical protein A3F93_01070 [Candidat